MKHITIRRLPFGPRRYWHAQLARIGTDVVWATRLIGRWYLVERKYPL